MRSTRYTLIDDLRVTLEVEEDRTVTAVLVDNTYTDGATWRLSLSDAHALAEALLARCALANDIMRREPN